MKKIIKWQSVIILSAIIGVLLMAQVIYKDDIKLPSDHWSRNIPIETIASDDNYYSPYYDVLTVNESSYLIEKINHTLTVLKLKEKGAFETVKSFDISDYDHDFTEISVGQLEDQTISLILCNQSELAYFTLNDTLSDLEFQNIIQDNIENITLNHGQAMYYKNHSLTLLDGNEELTISDSPKFEQYSFDFNASTSQYDIAFLKYDNGNYYSGVMTYDRSNQTTEEYELEKLPLIPGTISVNAVAFSNQDKLYCAMTLKNKKFAENYHFIYELDASKVNILNHYQFNTSSYTPHLQFVKIENEVRISVNQSTFIGKKAIGSNRKTYTNVVTSGFDNQTYIAHTKSNVAAANAVWFQNQGNLYLITNEITNGENTLYLSSNAREIIKESQSHMDWAEYINILLNALTFIPSSIMPLFVPLISLMIPVILIIIPVAIIKMSWVERHQNRMLGIAIITYLIFKARYLWVNQSDFIYSHLNYGDTPLHLSNGIGLFLTGLITTLISGLCLWLFTRKNPDSHFIPRFGFFFLIEMFLMLIFLIPYTMMFL